MIELSASTTLAMCNAICQEAEDEKWKMKTVGVPKVLLVSNFREDLEVDGETPS